MEALVIKFEEVLDSRNFDNHGQFLTHKISWYQDEVAKLDSLGGTGFDKTDYDLRQIEAKKVRKLIASVRVELREWNKLKK